jgi:hypothetical protein
MSIIPSFQRVISRNSREVTLYRVPENTEFVFKAASRDFRTNHPEQTLGNLQQEQQEYWYDAKEFDGTALPKVNDVIQDAGGVERTINEISPLWESSTSVGYRVRTFG